MDLINFLIGLALGILGLSMKRFLWLIRIMLSLGTAFMFLKLLHPLIVLRPVTEWTWHNLLNGYNFWFQSIIFLIISLLLFYWLIPFILRRILFEKLSSHFDNYFKRLNLTGMEKIKNIISKTVVKVLRFLQKIDPMPLNEKVNANYNLAYHNTTNQLISSFSISIHLIICWIFFIPSFKAYLYILIAILILLFAYNLIAIPFIKNFIDFINKTAIDELNRNIE